MKLILNLILAQGGGRARKHYLISRHLSFSNGTKINAFHKINLDLGGASRVG